MMVLEWEWQHQGKKGGRVIGDLNSLQDLYVLLEQRGDLAFARISYLVGPDFCGVFSSGYEPTMKED